MQEQIFRAYSDSITHGEIVEKGQKKFIVEGFISTTDKDLVNDIVTSRCQDSMESQMKSRVIKLDFEHEAFRGESELEMEANKTKMPLGKSIEVSRIRSDTQNGLKVRWELNPNWKKFDSKGNITMTYEEVKDSVVKGFYDAFSIAFIPLKSHVQQKSDGEKVRMLDEVNLLNVALTGNPVHPGAKMTNIFKKSLDFLDHTDIIKKEDEEMTEEEKVQENQVTEQAEEVATEAEAPEADAEVKSMGVEIKSLNDKISALTDEVSELKALVQKPVQKAIVQNAPVNEDKKELKSVEPLDLI